MIQLFKLLETVGLPAAIMALFIWWAYHKDKLQERRYDALCIKINDVQGEQRKELLDISIRAITAQADSTYVQKETIAANKELIAELKSRPCIARVG